MNLTTLIVDDEQAARDKLRFLLANEPDIECVGEAGTGDDAIRLIAELRPALLFLDIEMPPPNGLAVLRAARHEWQPVTVFTTAHAQYAVDAFELQAADYLLKPFGRDRLIATLARVRAIAGSGEGAQQQMAHLLDAKTAAPGPLERFLVKAHEKYVVVRAVDIIWAESAANYVVLHATNGNHVLRRTLLQLDGELDQARFFRASRSAIVNLDCIAQVEPLGAGEHLIFLTNGAKVPLTRSIRELQQRLQTPRPR